MDATVSPVKLKYAISQSFDDSGKTVAYTYIKVNVKSTEAEKKVKFVYKKPDGTWNKEPLFLEADCGNYEVFGSIDAPYAEEFAIEYNVDGVVYWDNQNGKNYRLLSNSDNAIGEQIILNRAIVKTLQEKEGTVQSQKTWIEGEIYVRKISFYKRVGLIYSIDGGKSWQEVEASYKGVEIEGAYTSVFNTTVEIWKFQTPRYDHEAIANEFTLALYYKNDEIGESYWDNNFGQNYKLSKVKGSTLE